MTRWKPPDGRARWILVCVILAAVLVTGDGAAAQVIGGGGMESCGSWTATARDFGEGRPVTQGRMQHLQHLQWVLGFLSGMAAYPDSSFDPLNNTDADGVWAWIDNYCGAHPLEKIVVAAKAFVAAHPR